MVKHKHISPWAWISTLYFAQGLPYVAVMTISVIMYKRLGISNTDIALYTGWLYLPWVIKPLWSPFVDIIKTKRWWTVTMQWILAIAFAGIAFTIPVPVFFQSTLAVFWLMGFTSATHDIAADGFYMLALSKHEQSLYVGIRSTFYRIATVVGQGLLVIIAGLIETNTGYAPAQLVITANPDIQPTVACIPKFDTAANDTAGEPHFIYTDSRLEISSTAPSEVGTIPFKTYSAALRDSVKMLNAINGFTNYGEGAATGPSTTSHPTNDKESAITSWIRDKFGEKRETTNSDLANNIAVVGVRLSRKPSTNEPVILNVTHQSGDRSIKLEQNLLSTRFEFTQENWDKPAYLFFEIDHKLKATAETSFIGTSGNIPFAWSTVFLLLSVFFLAVAIYHSRILPRPATDIGITQKSASSIAHEFIQTFVSFFKKKQIWVAITFMLLYRLPEAQLVKLINPFLLDPIDKGGLGLSTGEVGLVYGTIGVIGLTIGGIIGGIVASRGGLKKWLWPMAWSMSLTCLTFLYLSYFQTSSFIVVNICVFIEQFGYGFGFTAYTLYLIYFSEGRHKTAYYAICTGFMALGMMLPGMAAGWLQETIGYRHFFIWTIICCAATIGVCCLVKIDPKFGLKETSTGEILNQNNKEKNS